QTAFTHGPEQRPHTIAPLGVHICTLLDQLSYVVGLAAGYGVGELHLQWPSKVILCPHARQCTPRFRSCITVTRCLEDAHQKDQECHEPLSNHNLRKLSIECRPHKPRYHGLTPCGI